MVLRDFVSITMVSCILFSCWDRLKCVWKKPESRLAGAENTTWMKKTHTHTRKINRKPKDSSFIHDQTFQGTHLCINLVKTTVKICWRIRFRRTAADKDNRLAVPLISLDRCCYRSKPNALVLAIKLGSSSTPLYDVLTWNVRDLMIVYIKDHVL